MSAIAKWFNASSGYPKRALVIDFTKDRDALTLRAAMASDPEDKRFDPETELGDLWLTLLNSGFPVSALNFVLYGAEIDKETGKAKRIEAAVRQEKKPEYGYAYKPEQLAAFGVPQNLFVGAQLKMHGIPLFMVSALPYVKAARARKAAAPKPEIVRMTAAPATPQAPQIKRQRAQ